MDQTQSFENTTSVTSEMMLWTNSTPDAALNIAVTVLANESSVENITAEMIWSSDCGTFTIDYGIIACVICGIAFVIGVVFCIFGEYIIACCSGKISIACDAD